MIPRGIMHAVSVAPESLLNILPGPGQAGDKARNLPDKSNTPVEKPSKRDDFSKRLDREIDKRERPQMKYERDGVRPEEGKRTEGSSLERKSNESDAVLSRKEQKPFREIKDTEKGETATEVPQAKPDQANQEETPQVLTFKQLAAAIEEWLAKNIELIETGTLRVEAGPGGRAGLIEDQLGPRFAIEAPTASEIKSGTIDGAKFTLAAEIAMPRDAVAGSTTAEAGQPDAGAQGKPEQGGIPIPTIIDIENAAMKQEQVPIEEISRIQVPVKPDGKTKESIAGTKNTSASKPIPLNGPGPNDTSRPWWKVDNPVLKSEGSSTGRLEDTTPNGIEVTRVKQADVMARMAELINRSDRLFNSRMNVPNTVLNAEGLPADARAPFLVNVLQSANETAAPDKAPVANKPEVILFVENVERAVQDMGRESITSIRIRLHPPELGQLIVEFKRDENGLKVEFITTHPAVQRMLAEAGPKIIERLAEAGVDISSLDVSVGHGDGGEQRSFNPLDDPGKPPIPVNAPGDIEQVAGGVEADTGPVPYWPDDTTTIDLRM